MMKTGMRRRNGLGVVHLAFRDGGVFIHDSEEPKKHSDRGSMAAVGCILYTMRGGCRICTVH